MFHRDTVATDDREINPTSLPAATPMVPAWSVVNSRLAPIPPTFETGVTTLGTVSTAPANGVSTVMTFSGAAVKRYVRYLSPMRTNVFTVQAQNSTGTNVEQKVQAVTSTGTAPKALTYDLNGNVTKDESGNVYTWDAVNQLITIKYPSNATSNFAYDGRSRRTSIVEKNSSGTVTSTKLYLWLGNLIGDERNITNVVQKRFYQQGEQQSGITYCYTRDHLGGIRELISSAGTITSRLSCDVYGKTTIVSGTTLPALQYASYYNHSASGLYLTLRSSRLLRIVLPSSLRYPW